MIIESAHPYVSSTDQTWTYTLAGSPPAIDVTFDAQTEVEELGNDLLFVMDGAGKNIPGSPYTGTELAGRTLTVNGDTVKVRLLADSSYECWGFAVTTVVEGTPYTEVSYAVQSSHPYADSADETKTYTLPGNPSFVRVAFDAGTRVQEDCDYIHIADGSDVEIEGSPFTGTSLAGLTKSVDGKTVKIRLTSDESIAYWGYGATVSTGMKWKETRPAGDVDRSWVSCAASADGKKVIAAAMNKRLYLSTNGGSSWTETRPAGDTDKAWEAVASDADGSNLIAVVWHGAVYTSSDSGANWVERTLIADMSNYYWLSCASDDDGSTLVVGMQNSTNGGVFVSTDSGANWTQHAPAGNVFATWRSVACDSDGSVLLACQAAYNGGHLYKYTGSWADISPAAAVGLAWYRCALDSDGSVILAADYGRLGLYGAHPPDYTYPGRLWLSINGGTSWTEQRPMGDVDWFWETLAVDADGSLLLAGGRSAAGTADVNNPGRLFSWNGTWGEERPGGDTELTWYCSASDSDASFLIVGVNNGRLYILAPATPSSNSIWYQE